MTSTPHVVSRPFAQYSKRKNKWTGLTNFEDGNCNRRTIDFRDLPLFERVFQGLPLNCLSKVSFKRSFVAKEFA